VLAVCAYVVYRFVFLTLLCLGAFVLMYCRRPTTRLSPLLQRVIDVVAKVTVIVNTWLPYSANNCYNKCSCLCPLVWIGKFEIFNQYLCLSLLERTGQCSLFVSEMLTRCSHNSERSVNCNSKCTEKVLCWKRKIGTVYQTSGEDHVMSVASKCEIAASVHVMFPLLSGICNASYVISVCVVSLFFVSAVHYLGLIFGSGTDLISLLILLLLLAGSTLFKKVLRLRRFKSDRDEI